MKYLIVLLTLAGCVSNGTDAAGPISSPQALPSLVFLVAGQSNMVSITRTYPAIASKQGKVYVSDYNLTTGDFDNYLSIPTQTSPTYASSVWVRLGDIMNTPVAFVNVAVGGTHIAQWQSTYVNRILTQLQTRRYTAILWGQGESDQIDGTSELAYYNGLRDIILQSRRIQPDIRWFIATGSGNPAVNPIRSAQQHIIADGIAEAGPNTDSLVDNVEMDKENVHFIGSGAQAQAQLWYNVLSAQKLTK